MNIENLLSDKVKIIQPSGIRKFFDIVTEMKDAISLGVGEPDFVTPWHIREAGIFSLERGSTHYTSNAGIVELRQEDVYKRQSYTNIAAYQSLRQGVTVTDGMLPVNAYVHIYKAKNVKVDYYIDDAWATGSGEIPYSCNLDFSGLTPGAHEVKAVVEYEGGSQVAQVFSVNVEKDISLYVNGKKLATDVAPMLVQDLSLIHISG